MTLLDPVHGALAGVETVGQLLLGEPAMRASVPDELPDAALEVLSHDFKISHL